MHAGNAAKLIVPAHQRQGGRQRANGSSGVAHEQLCLLANRSAAQAVDFYVGASLTHAAAQRTKGIQHYAGVIRVQQVVQGGGAPA